MWWLEIEKAFPLESAWLRRDSENKPLEWFAGGEKVDFEKRLLHRVGDDLGPTGAGLRKEMQSLEKAKSPPTDRRWLDLYVKACRYRQNVELIERANPAALRSAIEDLAATFPAKYAGAPAFLKRLDSLEQRRTRRCSRR